MDAITVQFELEKTTPGTYRFKEISEPGKRPTIGTIYITKDKVGTQPPKKIEVTIKAVEG